MCVSAFFASNENGYFQTGGEGCGYAGLCTLGIFCPCLIVHRSCVPVPGISCQALSRASLEISRTGTLLFYLVVAIGYNAAKVQVMTPVPQPTGFGTGVDEHLGL